jgi:carotenoid cleavage dioxygenase
MAPNTNVGGFAGKTWAMVEAGGTPMTLSYDLDTIAFDAFDDTLPAGFSAHPKYDAATGSLHAMTYAYPDLADRIQYVVVGPNGQVTKTVDIPMDDMIMVHDMSLTQRYAVIYDLPVTVDFELALAERFPFRWNPEREARVGLLPRDGEAADIAWCPIEPCYVYHPLNAYDDADGNVVLDVCRYDRMFDNDIFGPFGDTMPMLERWTVNPTTRSVRAERISDRPQEFPRHADGLGGLPYQFGYTAELNVGLAADQPTFGKTFKIDVNSGETHAFDHGPGRGGAEPVFVAKDGSSAEDDGWLLISVYDANTEGSELVILDAQDFGRGEVARITLPQRVPDGFHGNWVPDA